MKQQIITISLSGPAGSGKTTIAEVIAETLRGIDAEGSGGRLEPFHIISDHGELSQEGIKHAAAGHPRVVVIRDYEAGCCASSEPSPAHQCCGKCEKPEAEAVAPADDPAVLRTIIEDLAGRLRQADAVIVSLVQKAGGEVTLSGDDFERAIGHAIEGDIVEDRSSFTFRAVPVQQQVAQDTERGQIDAMRDSFGGAQ